MVRAGGGWYAVMIKGVATPNLGFPKGKVNKGERLEDAAVRETYEEVGLSLRAPRIAHPGWAAGMARFFPVILDDAPFRFKFAPNCRGEIESIMWVPILPLADLNAIGVRLTRAATLVWPSLLNHIHSLTP